MPTSAVVSHESAAALWGLDARRVASRQLIVPRNVSAPLSQATAHRHDLRAAEVVLLDGVALTSPLRTVLDCARAGPFGWGLATADSALRLRLVGHQDLTHAARVTRGPGATAVRRVSRHADGRAASCLESLLRALLLDADLGRLALQVAIVRDGHAYDLAYPDAGVLIEADGAAYHGHRELDADCAGTTLAASEGFALLRFTWGQVTRRPAWVVDQVRRTVERETRRRRLERRAARARSARAASTP